MKKSNMDRLLHRYVAKEMSESETKKVEAFLKAVAKRKIQSISDETEELLCQNIRNKKLLPKDITRQVKNLLKLRVGDVEWMKFKGMDIYFDKSCY